ncbi:HAD family hydrolase [Microbacterium sp. 1P10UB]|uniref:HAD family hydrolase n=1 Tax=unclassified Microbacterium TaxID=2609290 RepID=UPI0039A3E202
MPDTGTVDVSPQKDAAELVQEIAEDATSGASERMLIALDIDGTVLLEDETLSPGIVDAVADAHAAGHEVMLATGRSWSGTQHIQQLLEIEPEYVVCSNGAVVLKRETDAAGTSSYVRFHTETFDPRTVLELLRTHLPDAHFMVELEDGVRLYTESMHNWNLSEAREVAFEELAQHPVSRVVVVAPDHSEEDFLALVSDIGLNQVSYAIGWTAWLDIAPMGVDKGTALEMVRGWLGVPSERVIVFGDGRNDMGMFAWALSNGGRAVAMGQGPQEVRDAAGERTTSVTEGGVAAVLRTL